MNTQSLTYIISCVFLMVLFSCSKDSQILNLNEENEKVQPSVSSFIFDEPEVSGNTFYLDPVNGSMNGDGSADNPWGGLQEVVENNMIKTFKHSTNNDTNSPLIVLNEGAPIKGGDKLILKNGYHGQLEITNLYFNEWLTIRGLEEKIPHLQDFI